MLGTPATALCKASVLNPLVAAECSDKAIKHCCTVHRTATVSLDRRDRLRVVNGDPAALFAYDKFDKKGGGSYYHLGAFGSGESSAHVPVRFFPFRPGAWLALFPEPADAVRATAAAAPRVLQPLAAHESLDFVYCASGWCGDWCPRSMFGKFPRFRTCDSCRERRKKVTSDKRGAAVAVAAAAAPAKSARKRKGLSVRTATERQRGAAPKAPKTSPAVLAAVSPTSPSGSTSPSSSSRIAVDPEFHVLGDLEGLPADFFMHTLPAAADPLHTFPAVAVSARGFSPRPAMPQQFVPQTPSRWPQWSPSPLALPEWAVGDNNTMSWEEVDGFLSSSEHTPSAAAASPALLSPPASPLSASSHELQPAPPPAAELPSLRELELEMAPALEPQPETKVAVETPRGFSPLPLDLWLSQMGASSFAAAKAAKAAPFLATCVSTLKGLVERKAAELAPAATAAAVNAVSVVKTELDRDNALKTWAFMLPVAFRLGGAPAFTFSRRPPPCRPADKAYLRPEPPLSLTPARSWHSLALASGPFAHARLRPLAYAMRLRALLLLRR